MHKCVVCNSVTADSLGDHSLLCMADGNAQRRKLWHDPTYRVWGAMCAKLSRLLSYPGSKQPATQWYSMKRSDLLIHDHTTSNPNTFIDFITCVVAKSSHVRRAASLPGAAADAGVLEKNNHWLDLVTSQGDRFLAIAQEDGGATNEDALELLESAVRRGGGTVREQQAMRTY